MKEPWEREDFPPPQLQFPPQESWPKKSYLQQKCPLSWLRACFLLALSRCLCWASLASLCSAVSWLRACSLLALSRLRWTSLASLSCTVSLAVAWTSESFVLFIFIQLWRNVLWSRTTSGLVSQMTHALMSHGSTPPILEMPMAPVPMLHVSCVHCSLVGLAPLAQWFRF